MWGYHGIGGYGMGIGMVLFWAIVFAAIVALVWGFGARSRGGSSPPAARTALDVLAERYAKGEIDKEEFETKRRDLSSM